jgi:hypothetical protein
MKIWDLQLAEYQSFRKALVRSINKPYQMNVNDKIQVSPNHSIEWGEATWDSNDFSVRNRYNTDTGKFNQAGSSELPRHDFLLMIKESIGRNKFSNTELSKILTEISNKIAKTP